MAAAPITVNLHGGGTSTLTTVLQLVVPVVAIILTAWLTYVATTKAQTKQHEQSASDEDRRWAQQRRASASDVRRDEALRRILHVFDLLAEFQELLLLIKAELVTDQPNRESSVERTFELIRSATQACTGLALVCGNAVLETAESWRAALSENSRNLIRSDEALEIDWRQIHQARANFVAAVRLDVGLDAL
jgi:hypothetical protein